MKRKLLLLFAFLGIVLFTATGCRMRYASPPSFSKKGMPTRTSKHYGAKKSIWQRRSLWGNKRYGPRPHGHRGWYRH